MLKNRWIIPLACLGLGGFFFNAAADSAPSAAPDSGYIVKPVEEQWLSESSVIAMTQTHDGYLWLGTLNGLARFDGVRCTVFTEANTPELKSSPIVCLFEDSRSNLWVGTETAGIVIIRKDGAVQPVQLPGRIGGKLVSLSEDAGGTVWLNLADGLVAHCRTSEPSAPGAPVRPDVLNTSARPAVVEKSGLLWLGVGTNLFGFATLSNATAFVMEQDVHAGRLDYLLASRRGGHWRLADNRIQKWTKGNLDLDLGPYPWASARVLTACEDNDGNLIVGTQDEGLFWFHGPGRVTHLSGANGLSHNTVLSLCMDREGVLWVGTDGGGLNCVRPRQFTVEKDSAGLTIQSVCDDRQGGVWYANLEGKLFHAKNGSLTQYGDSEGLPVSTVLRSVLTDRSGNVWVGSLRGLFRMEWGRFRGLPGQPGISALFQDRQGLLWMGSQGGLLRWDGKNLKTFTTTDGLSANHVRALAEDAAGNLWIGTVGGGLDCLRDGKFTVVRKIGGLPSDTISALCVDNEGVLWIGTAGGGLARFFKNKWTTYTTAEGLSANSISYLIQDNEGYLWVGSNMGLMRIARNALNDYADGKAASVWCRVYLKPDGLPTHECTQGSQPAACRSSDGRLWFATIRGLVSVNPASLKPNGDKPPVVIESVTVQGREQMTNALIPDSLRAVIVPPGKELLEIRYTSLNLAAADRARFRYKLEGLETGWTDARERRLAPFSNLRPGRYVFHVIACNEDGVWNEAGARLAVIVLPPFWRTTWFITVNALALLALVIFVVRYISTQKLQRQLALLRQHEAVEKERARIARDLHDQLGANLTQVALLGEMAESDKNLPDEVESHARQISQTARETTQALDEIVWAANPSNDTLEGLVTYSLKYAQEYLELAGVSHRLEVPAQLPDAGVAPEVRHNVFLAFKEAVNNVVKHAQATSVRIRLRLEPDRFTLEIEDNGRGLANPEGKPGRNGLRNMRKRLDDVGGSFEIGPAAGQGTLVRLTAPIEKH